MNRLVLLSALAALAFGASARTVALWPLGQKTNGSVDTRCATSPAYDLQQNTAFAVAEASSPAWNLPPNADAGDFLYPPVRYGAIESQNAGNLNGGVLWADNEFINTIVSISNEAFTVEGWVRLDEAVQWRIVIQAGNGSGGSAGWCLSWRVNTTGPYFNFYVENEAGSAALLGDTNVKQFTSEQFESDLNGRWHHLAITFRRDYSATQSQWKFYLDGVDFGKSCVHGKFDPSKVNASKITNRFDLGGRTATNSQRLKGAFAYWRVSDKVLAREEFLDYDPIGTGGTIVEKPTPKTYTNTTAHYWKLGANLDGSLDLNDSVGKADLHGGYFEMGMPYKDGKVSIYNTTLTPRLDCAFEGNPPNADLGALGNRGSLFARSWNGANTTYNDGPNVTWLGSRHPTLVVPNLGAELSPTNSFTVEGWIKAQRDNVDIQNRNQLMIVGNRTIGYDSWYGWGIKYNLNQHKILLYANEWEDGKVRYLSCDTVLAENLQDLDGWHHLALVYDRDDGRGTWTLYIDGVKQYSRQNDREPTLGPCCDHFVLGARASDSNGWLGGFDCWRVTKRALAPKELMCYPNADKTPVSLSDPDLLALWPLNVLGTHHFDGRDLTGNYTIRGDRFTGTYAQNKPFDDSAYSLGLDAFAPTIANPDCSSNFCGSASSTNGAVAFCREGAGSLSYLATSARDVVEVFNSTAWTLEGYVRRNGLPASTWQVMFIMFASDSCFTSWPACRMILKYAKDDTFEFEDNQLTKGTHKFGTAGLANDTDWHHIALVADFVSAEQGYRMYVDGRQIGYVPLTRNCSYAPPAWFVMGGRPIDSNTSFRGSFSNVRLSKAALAPSQFLCAAGPETPVAATETLGYWALDSADGTSLAATNSVAGSPIGKDFWQVRAAAGSSVAAEPSVPNPQAGFRAPNVGSAAIPETNGTLRSSFYELTLDKPFTAEGWIRWNGAQRGKLLEVASAYDINSKVGWRLQLDDTSAATTLRILARTGETAMSPIIDEAFDLGTRHSVPAEAWRAVAITYDPTVGRGVWTLYLDSRLVGQVENEWRNDGYANQPVNFCLGRPIGSSMLAMPGEYDMWRLSSGIRTREELLAYYKKGCFIFLR